MGEPRVRVMMMMMQERARDVSLRERTCLRALELRTMPLSRQRQGDTRKYRPLSGMVGVGVRCWGTFAGHPAEQPLGPSLSLAAPPGLML